MRTKCGEDIIFWGCRASMEVEQKLVGLMISAFGRREPRQGFLQPQGCHTCFFNINRRPESAETPKRILSSKSEDALVYL